MTRRRQRHGVVFLELILVLPVVAIFLAAVVQFGLIQINAQHVTMASRVGAKALAENTSLTAAQVKAEVDRYFELAGFGAGASAGVRIAASGGGVGTTDGMCADTGMGFTTTIPARKVRVCMDLTKLTPNLLNVFGYDISSHTYRAETVFPEE